MEIFFFFVFFSVGFSDKAMKKVIETYLRQKLQTVSGIWEDGAWLPRAATTLFVEIFKNNKKNIYRAAYRPYSPTPQLRPHNGKSGWSAQNVRTKKNPFGKKSTPASEVIDFMTNTSLILRVGDGLCGVLTPLTVPPGVGRRVNRTRVSGRSSGARVAVATRRYTTAAATTATLLLLLQVLLLLLLIVVVVVVVVTVVVVAVAVRRWRLLLYDKNHGVR